MLKRFFLSAISMLSILAAQAQQAPATADDILKEASIRAAKEKKNVFVMFTASWCGWCKKMDRSIADSVCRKFFYDNYIITHLVVNESKERKELENPGAEDLLVRSGGKDMGIPYWLVFDKDGKLLADSRLSKEDKSSEKWDNTGCPATEKEVNHFIDVLKKTSSIKTDELEIIRKRFRKNDL